MRTKTVAALLDEGLMVYITTDLRLRLAVRSKDLLALDALTTLAGDSTRSGGVGIWGTSKEKVALKLLRTCLPLMVKRKELAEAIVEFLEAETSEGMLSGLLDILYYKRTGQNT